jgi:phage/plasmid-like protein (TIGR03299 family)
MAHELMHDHMAYVGQVPWRGLGKAVPADATAQRMIVAAGLGWKVAKVPAPGAKDDGKGRYNRYLIVREPTAYEFQDVVLGVVGHGYEILQNDKAFEFFEPFIASHAARFETAGALRDGERVWVLAKLADPICVVEGDVVDRYLLLSNSHDGRGAVSIRFTPIRVVCKNTLNLAIKGGSATVHVRHTQHMHRRLARAQQEKLAQVIEATFKAATELFCMMAKVRLTSKLQTDYLEHILPRTAKQKADDFTPDRWQRIAAILHDEQVTPAPTRDTLWALYNAIVRDEDFRETRERHAERRLERVWFGSGSELKLKALDLARQLAEKTA